MRGQAPALIATLALFVTGCEEPRPFAGLTDPRARSLLVGALREGALSVLAAHDLDQARGVELRFNDDDSTELIAVSSRCPLEVLGLEAGLLTVEVPETQRTLVFPGSQAFDLPKAGGDARPIPVESPKVQALLASMPFDWSAFCAAQTVGIGVQEVQQPIDLVPGYPDVVGHVVLESGMVVAALASNSKFAEGVLLDRGVFYSDPLQPPIRATGLDRLEVMDLAGDGEVLVLADRQGGVYRGTVTGTTAHLFDVGANQDVSLGSSRGGFSTMLVWRADRVSWLLSEGWSASRILDELPPNEVVSGPSWTRDGSAVLLKDRILVATSSGVEELPLPPGLLPSDHQFVPGLGDVFVSEDDRVFVHSEAGWRTLPNDPSFQPLEVFRLGRGLISLGRVEALPLVRPALADGSSCPSGEVRIPIPRFVSVLPEGRLLVNALTSGESRVHQMLLNGLDGPAPHPCLDP